MPKTVMSKKQFLYIPLTLSILLLCATPIVHAETYGDGVSLKEATSIAEIIATPEKWDGKEVRVEGTVNDVCPKKGCWMSLRSAEAAIRVKVEDGVIVFPLTAKDRQAVAEGVVRVIPMERERYVSWLRHLAEERDETFDPSVVGEGPYQLVQIQGSGAEIDL